MLWKKVQISIHSQEREKGLIKIYAYADGGMFITDPGNPAENS